MNNKRNIGVLKIILSLIFILALSLLFRFYRLDQNVPSLYADEVGGNYIILNQLHTPIGGVFDFFTKILNGITHFSWAFGLNPFGVRFGSALYGSFIPVSLFFLGYMLSKKNYFVALVSGILGIVLPWSFMISRIAHTHIPAIAILTCIHLALITQAKNFRQFIISLIPVAISVFFYPIMIIVAPIGAVIVFFRFIFPSFSSRQKKLVIIIGTLSIVIIGAIFIRRYSVFSTQGRGGDLAIWRDANVTADYNEYRGLARQNDAGTEIISNKLLYNYPLSVIHVFTKNYLSFFSLDFLFFKGDGVLRHSIGTVGEFFVFLIPFMIYGIYCFFKKANSQEKIILLSWIIMCPVPAAITKDGATYLLRVITLMPVLTYFCSVGIASFFDLFKNKLVKLFVVTTIVVIGLFSTYRFVFEYFHVYPALSAESWESGFKELSDFQAGNPGKLLTVWEDKYPVWYFCFWQKLPSSVCDPNKVNTSETINETRIDLPIENLLFSLPKNEYDLDQIMVKYKPKYVAIPEKYSQNFPEFTKKAKVLQDIFYPDKSVAFKIYQVNK